jgi:hypothetical protein
MPRTKRPRQQLKQQATKGIKKQSKKATKDKQPEDHDLSGLIGNGTKKGTKKVVLKLLKIKEEVQYATTDLMEGWLVEDEEQQLEQLETEFDFDHRQRVLDWINAGQLSVEGLSRREKMVVGLFACKNLHERLTNQLSEFQDDEEDDQDEDDQDEDDQDEDDQEDDQDDDDHEADEELIEDLIDRMTVEFDQVAQLDDPDWKNVDFLEQMQEAFDQEY